MADMTQQKRQREEETNIQEDFDGPKKQKTTQNQILSSILDEYEDETNQDLADIFTTLQQELTFTDFEHDPLLFTPFEQQQLEEEEEEQKPTGVSTTPDCSPSCKENKEDGVSNNVMRHLLEASDDELGLPNREESGGDDEINGGDFPFVLSDGLWEFEDETANYYAMLQSELFM